MRRARGGAYALCDQCSPSQLGKKPSPRACAGYLQGRLQGTSRAEQLLVMGTLRFARLARRDLFFELPEEVIQFVEFGDQRVRINVELPEKFGNGMERPSVFSVMLCRRLSTFRSSHDCPPSSRASHRPKTEIKSKPPERDCPHASEPRLLSLGHLSERATIAACPRMTSRSSLTGRLVPPGSERLFLICRPCVQRSLQSAGPCVDGSRLSRD